MRASANSVFRSGVNEDEQKLPVTREECKRRLQLRREVRRHREQSHRAEETAEEKAHSLLVQNQGNCQRRENEGTEHRAQRLQVQNVANARHRENEPVSTCKGRSDFMGPPWTSQKARGKDWGCEIHMYCSSPSWVRMYLGSSMPAWRGATILH